MKALRKVCVFVYLSVLFSAIAHAEGVPKKVDIEKLVPTKSYDMIKRVDMEEAFDLEKDSAKGKSLLLLKPQFVDALNIAVAESRFLSIDASGKASGIFGKASAETKSVRVLIDYGRYMTAKVGEKSGNIGYLLRLDAEITNFSSDADLSSVFAVGFAAKMGKIQGKIKITTIGLSGKNLDNYISLANSISEDSLLKALENFAILRSKINTDEITINPDWLPEAI